MKTNETSNTARHPIADKLIRKRIEHDIQDYSGTISRAKFAREEFYKAGTEFEEAGKPNIEDEDSAVALAFKKWEETFQAKHADGGSQPPISRGEMRNSIVAARRLNKARAIKKSKDITSSCMLAPTRSQDACTPPGKERET